MCERRDCEPPNHRRAKGKESCKTCINGDLHMFSETSDWGWWNCKKYKQRKQTFTFKTVDHICDDHTCLHSITG